MLSRNFSNNTDQRARPRGDTERNKEQGVLKTTRRTTQRDFGVRNRKKSPMYTPFLDRGGGKSYCSHRRGQKLNEHTAHFRINTCIRTDCQTPPRRTRITNDSWSGLPCQYIVLKYCNIYCDSKLFRFLRSNTPGIFGQNVF